MDFETYLAGFFDGDSSITVEKQNGGYTLRIKFHQSNKEYLEIIQKRYPFLKLGGGKRESKQRTEYCLRGSGVQIFDLMDKLSQRCIIKYEQVLEGKKYSQLIDQLNVTTQKEQIYNKLRDLKKTGSTNKPYERLNTLYIAGLFDAEGSVGVYGNKLRVKITQKSDHEILRRIAQLYNNTTEINNHAICFYEWKCLEFLQDMERYCIYKRPQIRLALQFLQTQDHDAKGDIAGKLKQLKLQDEFIQLNKERVIVQYDLSACQPSTRQYALEHSRTMGLINVQQSSTNNTSQRFNEEEMKYLIQLRLDNMTSEDASQKFKDKFKKNVKRDVISSFWQGKMEVEEDIRNSDDYKAMVGYKRKRVVKFTDEELSFVKSLEEASSTKCVEIFKAKFGKDITKQYIAKVKTATNT